MQRSRLTTDSAGRLQLVDPVSLQYPERIIQIGEGRFLRGFADWFVHQLNRRGAFHGRVVVVAPRESGSKNIEVLNEQNGLFTVWLQGISQGEPVNEHEVISSVSRGIDAFANWHDFLQCAESRDIQFLLSNTTEAGLTYQPENYHPGGYQTSFPAKLTAYLYHRFQFFEGSPDAGMTIIPCELVDNNGDVLRDIVIQHARDWGLPSTFMDWLTSYNHFCNSLVDRIVTGFPTSAAQDEWWNTLGYEDDLLTVAEPFYLWAIEGDERLRHAWPAQALGMNVHIVKDVGSFRTKKVRILNGAHTAMCAPTILANIRTVGEAMNDKVFGTYIRQIVHDEIIPSLTSDEFPEKDLVAFAETVFDRFCNPSLRHEVSALALNGLSKFRVRILPTIHEFANRYGSAPRGLSASFAALLLYYRNENSTWVIQDNPEQVSILQQTWESAKGLPAEEATGHLLALSALWGSDLNLVPGLTREVSHGIQGIQDKGISAYVEHLI